MNSGQNVNRMQDLFFLSPDGIYRLVPDTEPELISQRLQRSDNAEKDAENFAGPPISTYTRAQAIEDGVLVDLMQAETVGAVREAGFRVPVAMTAAAFSQTVMPIDGSPLPEGQDLQGRLWDVLWMLKLAIRRSDNPLLRPGPASEVRFSLLVNRRLRRHDRVELKALYGPGDNREPVITIMLPDED